jgi:UDP-2,3-diacylglucosamine pyrophosphatase LpxH
MHERLLDKLLAVANVHLVASLRDDRLGFPATNDIRVFIPDIHLISEKRQKQGAFPYRTNCTELLTSVATALAEFRDSSDKDEVVAVYQMGDFLDLWREAPGLDDKADAAAAIKDDHEDLVAALLSRKLKARFLLGNHDLDLYRWPDYSAWERRYYLPDDSVGSPRVIALHGDIFDWMERFLPDKVQSLFVYLFAPHLSPNDYALGEMKAAVAQSHGRRNYATFIQAASPAPVGVLQQLGADSVPARWNVQVEGSAPPDNVIFLNESAKACTRANSDFGLSLCTTIIGHTHHARIAVRETVDGRLHTLVDCGAWIENCVSTPGGVPMPNAQIAALSGNEVRIYQLEDRKRSLASRRTPAPARRPARPQKARRTRPRSRG